MTATISGGIIVGYVAAFLFAVIGLVTILDWRGFGKRFYEFASDLPIFGAGWTENRGFATFRFGMGAGFLGFGVLVFAVLTIAALSTS